MTNNKPWDRREGESSKNYEAFCAYRDMGIDRSIQKVAEKLKKSTALMGRWSAKYGWIKRAEAWDEEQERIEREAARKDQLKAIKEMRKRHADLATGMLIKAARALQRIPEDEITAGSLSKMVEIASKLERISRGDVGEVVEERQGEAGPSAVTFYMPDNGRDKEEE